MVYICGDQGNLSNILEVHLYTRKPYALCPRSSFQKTKTLSMQMFAQTIEQAAGDHLEVWNMHWQHMAKCRNWCVQSVVTSVCDLVVSQYIPGPGSIENKWLESLCVYVCKKKRDPLSLAYWSSGYYGAGCCLTGCDLAAAVAASSDGAVSHRERIGSKRVLWMLLFFTFYDPSRVDSRLCSENLTFMQLFRFFVSYSMFGFSRVLGLICDELRFSPPHLFGFFAFPKNVVPCLFANEVFEHWW